MTSRQVIEAAEECKRIGKSKYILKLLHGEILSDLTDVSHISRQLNIRGALSESESKQVLSQKEWSTYSPTEVLLGTLNTKQSDDIDSFWDLLRETKQDKLVAQIEEKQQYLEYILASVLEPVLYSLPAKVPLTSEDQPDTFNVNQFNPDIIATSDGVIRLIKRNNWGALPSKGEMSQLKHPIEYVILSHTASIGSYMSTFECVQACRQAQQLNMGWGWSDIAYNFMVGNDGVMYEGRGWNHESNIALGWNSKSIGIGFIGKYVERMPSDVALDVLKSFLQYMVDEGILKNDFTIHCLRQIRSLFPVAPGDMLYAEIKTWQGKGLNTWAWRKFETVEDKETEYSAEEKLSPKLQETIKAETECLTKQIVSAKQVLRFLAQNNVFTIRKQQKILENSRTDEELMVYVMEHIVTGKKEWFTIFLEALLVSNQRLLATTLWRMVPTEDKKTIKRPLLKLKVGKEPIFKDITLDLITFDKPIEKNKSGMVELGAGSFGIVVLASYLPLGGAKVAVKKIKGSEQGEMNDRHLQDFKKEAKTMYSLRHPDIVTIYGTICDRKEHVYGIVMEYMEVGSLDDLISKIEIPWAVKVRMLRDVCQGLTFLNTPQPDRNYTVTHCDIKAKNILINEKFSAKVTDFGEAVLQNIASQGTSNKSLSSDHTHGTVTHMSPDLLFPVDSMYDPNEKTDVWSFGITVFEVCAENTKGTAERRTPFGKRMKPIQITAMIGMQKQSPFNEHEMEKIPKECPEFLIELMKRCCELESEHRLVFKDASEILEQNYQETFRPQIHKSLAQLHKMYAHDVLNMATSFEDNTGDGEYSLDSFSSEKSRKKELEDLELHLLTVESKLLDDSVDKNRLHVSVNDIAEAKFALQQEWQLVKDTSESDLIAPLEKTIRQMEIKVKQQIDDAKEEIINFNKKSRKERGEELEKLEERLTKHLLRLTSEDITNYDFTDSNIRQNFTELVELIDPDEILDYLYQELLSFDDYERIRKQVTRMDKNRMLLVFVDKKGTKGIHVLCTALRKKEALEGLCKYLKTE